MTSPIPTAVSERNSSPPPRREPPHVDREPILHPHDV
jgi:hypothetical protein